jgi:hypothetical protein
MVCKVLTTFDSGNHRWICSPRESVFDTESVGGMPLEKAKLARSHTGSSAPGGSFPYYHRESIPKISAPSPYRYRCVPRDTIDPPRRCF